MDLNSENNSFENLIRGDALKRMIKEKNTRAKNRRERKRKNKIKRLNKKKGR